MLNRYVYITILPDEISHILSNQESLEITGDHRLI